MAANFSRPSHTWAMWSNNCTILLSSQENSIEYAVRASNEEMQYYLIATLCYDASIRVRFTSLNWLAGFTQYSTTRTCPRPHLRTLDRLQVTSARCFLPTPWWHKKTLTSHNQDEVVLWMVFLWIERLSQIVRLAKARFNLIAVPYH